MSSFRLDGVSEGIFTLVMGYHIAATGSLHCRSLKYITNKWLLRNTQDISMEVALPEFVTNYLRLDKLSELKITTLKRI